MNLARLIPGLCFLTLSACGENTVEHAEPASIAYGGHTHQVSISSDNKEELALVALSALRNINRSRGIPLQAPVVSAQLGPIYLHGGEHGGGDEPVAPVGACGGTVSVSSSAAGTVLNYEDYCISGSDGEVFSINGTATHSETATMDIVSFEYITVTEGAAVSAYSGNFELDKNSGEVFYNLDFADVGEPARTEQLQMTGLASTGLSILQGRVFHPDHGYFDVATSSDVILAGCESGSPMSGKITMSGSGGSNSSVEFLGCHQYQVCINGDSLCRVLFW